LRETDASPPRSIDERLIAEIVRRVLGVASPTRLILFGSAAAGAMTRDSDIDLLLVVPRPDSPLRMMTRVGDALRGLGFPFDVIVIDEERFEETKDVVGGIAFPANKYGRVIYEAA
jgi:predicted nucleotidyltransferase